MMLAFQLPTWSCRLPSTHTRSPGWKAGWSDGVGPHSLAVELVHTASQPWPPHRFVVTLGCRLRLSFLRRPFRCPVLDRPLMPAREPLSSYPRGAREGAVGIWSRAGWMDGRQPSRLGRIVSVVAVACVRGLTASRSSVVVRGGHSDWRGGVSSMQLWLGNNIGILRGRTQWPLAVSLAL
jgi:hypothetical protein